MLFQRTSHKGTDVVGRRYVCMCVCVCVCVCVRVFVCVTKQDVLLRGARYIILFVKLYFLVCFLVTQR